MMRRKSIESGIIDVLVPTYNHELYIEECLRSLLAQTYTKTRIHVIDDKSTDNTFSIARKFQDQFPDRISAVQNSTNIGSGSDSIISQRLGLRGEFWALVEGDDLWLNDEKLEMQVAAMRKNVNVVVVTGNTEIIGNMNSMISPSLTEWNYLDLKLCADRFSFFTHISSALWRNIFNHKKSPFPKKYVVDRTLRGEVGLMQTYLSKTRGIAHNLDQTLSCYRYTGLGMWSSLSTAEQELINEKMFSDLNKLKPMMYRLSLFNNGSLLSTPLGKHVLPKPLNFS